MTRDKIEAMFARRDEAFEDMDVQARRSSPSCSFVASPAA